MQKQNNEIKMIWLMVLIITAVATWFLDHAMLSFLCVIAFVVSVMQFVGDIEKPAEKIARNIQTTFQVTSKIPLYLSSITALVGTVMEWHWVVGLAATTWIFFFLRWLRKLERNLSLIQQNIQAIQQSSNVLSTLSIQNNDFLGSHAQNLNSSKNLQGQHAELGFVDQIKQWLFKGNPVLKVAIVVLVIGLILLLRFATEHWQLSLSLKLALVACVSILVTIFGLALQNKNRSFALALEGLGLAGLFLTLFFAYYNQVIANFWVASFAYAVIMAITLVLSFRQQAVELALMAMLIAYIAPFTLPVRDASAVELVAYYLVINIAVAILSTLRPWKILNQIAFLVTIFIGGGYAFFHGHVSERSSFTILVLAHTAIFVWLGFRFSQLLAKRDLEQFKLKPALDIALIFSAPILAYLCLYLMYFEETSWQAGLSLGFAVLFALLYQWAKRNQAIGFIAQSYLSLTLIFLALIPPILLPDQWSVAGWAIEGVLIFIYALYGESKISRYLAIGLLIVAGLSSLYYWVESTVFPSQMYWILSSCYVLTVFIANLKVGFQKQLSVATVVFLSVLMCSASSLYILLFLDALEGKYQLVLSLCVIGFAFLLLNEWMLKCKATWTWLLPKWFGLIPLMLFALWIVLDRAEKGVLQWESTSNQIGFAIAGLTLATLWLRPLLGVNTEREWVSLGTISALALASLSVIPSMPFISVVIFPLLFCMWCALQKQQPQWHIFWQTRSSLCAMLAWIICSQLFSQQAFQSYLFPILNPFDLISLAMLAGFIWMLLLQLKSGLDQGIVAILMVLSLLWLSSYIVLRGLHIYLATPYNDIALWQNATVQLSLTLLWVSLAFICMSVATKKQIRPMWVLGASILFIVTLKLVLLDLSNIGTLMRVLSFLGAGLIMLIIAYIAPMPEREQVAFD